MLKHFTLFTALILTVFVVGCSEGTSIFIKEVNILGIDDSDDSAAWLVSGALEEICEVPGVCPGATEIGELLLPEHEFPGNDEDDDEDDTDVD